MTSEADDREEYKTDPKGMDASVWAAAFMERFGHRKEVIDEGLMIGWFANAIMAGFDYARETQLP